MCVIRYVAPLAKRKILRRKQSEPRTTVVEPPDMKTDAQDKHMVLLYTALLDAACPKGVSAYSLAMEMFAADPVSFRVNLRSLQDSSTVTSISSGSVVLSFMRGYCMWPIVRHELQTKGAGGYMQPAKSRRQWCLFQECDHRVVVTGDTAAWKDCVVFHVAPRIVLKGTLCPMMGDGLCNGHAVLYITLTALQTSCLTWERFVKEHPYLVPIFEAIVVDPARGRVITLSNLWKEFATEFRTTFLRPWVDNQPGFFPSSDKEQIYKACSSPNMSLLYTLYRSDFGSTLGNAFQAFVSMDLHTLQVQATGDTFGDSMTCSDVERADVTPMMFAARKSALVNWTEIEDCVCCDRTHPRHYDVLEDIVISLSEEVSIPSGFAPAFNVFRSRRLSPDMFEALVACPLQCTGEIEVRSRAPSGRRRLSALVPAGNQGQSLSDDSVAASCAASEGAGSVIGL
jgi:hypothetical protein